MQTRLTGSPDTPRMSKPSRDGRRLPRRRWLASMAGAAGLALLKTHDTHGQQCTPAASPYPAARDWQRDTWVGSWSAGMHVASPGMGEEFPSQIFELGGLTLRQVARLSLGGTQVRIRLSNIFGEEPVTIGAAHIAMRESQARIDPATDHVVTVSGLPSFTIPAGAVVLSDPVDLAVPHLAELAVSLYFPEPATSQTVHSLAFQTNYLSDTGDFSAETALPVATELQNWLYLNGVDVAVTEPTSAIACLGDSITDGAFSTPDTNHRWPDYLADRLARSGQPMRGVLNQGIGGNTVVRDPQQPTRLLPGYDGGDHLHLNDAGFQGLAEAIDLELLAGTIVR